MFSQAKHFQYDTAQTSRDLQSQNQPEFFINHQVPTVHLGSVWQLQIIPQIILMGGPMGHQDPNRPQRVQHGGYQSTNFDGMNGSSGMHRRSSSSKGMRKREFDSRVIDRDRGPKQSGGHLTGCCRDCGKFGPLFGSDHFSAKFGQNRRRRYGAEKIWFEQTEKIWCNACSKKHPGAKRVRTKGELHERANRSSIFRWAKAADPPRCAFFNLVTGCPSLAKGNPCKRVRQSSPLYAPL